MKLTKELGGGGKYLPPDSNGPAQNLHTVFTCIHTKIFLVKKKAIG